MGRVSTAGGLVALTVSLLTACAGLGGPAGSAADLPRQAPDATEVLYLVSNENCEFFVDGQSLATGKSVRVFVTKTGHRVVCKPEGYRAKEDLIQPPFNPYHPVRFMFMLEDRLSR